MKAKFIRGRDIHESPAVTLPGISFVDISPNPVRNIFIEVLLYRSCNLCISFFSRAEISL